MAFFWWVSGRIFLLEILYALGEIFLCLQRRMKGKRRMEFLCVGGFVVTRTESEDGDEDGGIGPSVEIRPWKWL